MLNFLHFIFDCAMNAIGAVVGSVYDSSYEKLTAGHGAIAGCIFMVSTFALVKIFGIDHEGHFKYEWSIPVSILISTIISIIYLSLAYFLCLKKDL